jgi:tetratricopeptide (TPR) repeat protein
VRLIHVWAVVLLGLSLNGCDKVREQAIAQVHQDDLQKTFAQAHRLHDQGRSKEAIRVFEGIVQDPSASPAQKSEALRYISLGYYELGNYPLSGEYAAQAAAFFPEQSYEYLVNMADADLMLGRVPEARVRLSRAVELRPRSLAANNVLGLLYLGDNGAQYADYPKALGFNQAAYDIAPGRITRIVLARSYLSVHDYALAAGHLRELHQQFPQDARVRELLDEAEAGLSASASSAQSIPKQENQSP